MLGQRPVLNPLIIDLKKASFSIKKKIGLFGGICNIAFSLWRLAAQLDRRTTCCDAYICSSQCHLTFSGMFYRGRLSTLTNLHAVTPTIISLLWVNAFKEWKKVEVPVIFEFQMSFGMLRNNKKPEDIFLFVCIHFPTLPDCLIIFVIFECMFLTHCKRTEVQ